MKLKAKRTHQVIKTITAKELTKYCTCNVQRIMRSGNTDTQKVSRVIQAAKIMMDPDCHAGFRFVAFRGLGNDFELRTLCL